MKRFSFRPQSLLDWKRRQAETLEAEIARLRARKALSLARSAELLAESDQSRKTAVAGPRLNALALQAGAGWSEHLVAQSRAAAEAARRLEVDARRLLAELAKARREVDGLERLRERKKREWAREADREAETLATELYLSRRHQSKSDDVTSAP